MRHALLFAAVAALVSSPAMSQSPGRPPVLSNIAPWDQPFLPPAPAWDGASKALLRDASDVPAGFWTPGAAMQHKLIKRLQDHAGLTFEVEK